MLPNSTRGRPPGVLTMLRRLPVEIDNLARYHARDVKEVAGDKYPPLTSEEATAAPVSCPSCGIEIMGFVNHLRSTIAGHFFKQAVEIRRKVAGRNG